MMHWRLHRIATLGWLVCLSAAVAGGDEIEQSALVGRSVMYHQLVLEGPELEVKPITDETPVVVRITDVYPHGTAFRYHLEAYALESGTFNLLDYLHRTDGTPTSGLAPIMLRVEQTLLDPHAEPHPLRVGRLPWLGSYRAVIVLSAFLWVAGLIWLLRSGRRPTTQDDHPASLPVTTADLLRPLVRDALGGRLADDQRALLERLLLAHWREQLQLTDLNPHDALGALRQHEQAGYLLRHLEDWLHRPDPPQQVDLEALLAPYAQVESPSTPSDETTARAASKEATAR